MALPRQIVSFPFAGVQQKSSPVTLQPGEMLRIENGFFQGAGEVRKRFGYSQIWAALNSSTSYNRLVSKCDGLVSVSPGATRYNSATSTAAVVNHVGRRVTATVDEIPGSLSSGHVSDIALHTTTGIAVATWVNSSGNPDGSAIDLATGSPKVALALGAPAGTVGRVRVVATASYVAFVTSNTSGQVNVRTYDPATWSIVATTTPYSNLDATGWFDVTPSPSHTNNIYLAFRRAAGSGGGLTVARINLATGLVVVSASDASETIDRCLGWQTTVNPLGTIWLATGSSTAGVRSRAVTESTAAIAAPVTINAAATNARNATGLGGDVFYDHDDGTNGRAVYRGTNRLSWNSAIVSRYFDAGDGFGYMWLTNDGSPINGMVSLVRVFPGGSVCEPVTKVLYGQSPATTEACSLSSVISVDASRRSIVTMVRQSAPQESVAEALILKMVTADLSAASAKAPPIEFGCYLGMTGLDGWSTSFAATQSLTPPSQWGIPPEAPSLVSLGSLGLMTPSSSYQYVVVYERADSAGNVWRSAPSAPLNVALGSGDNMATVRVRNSGVSASVSGVGYAVYRTGANGTTLYKLRTGFIATSQAYVDVTDTAADTSIDGNEQLYTTIGGELPNYPGGTFDVLAQFRGRLFGVPSEDPTRVMYTKQMREGVGPEWVGVFTFRIRDDAGPITAIAEMDDKLILFKRNAAYVLTGDGPDLAGNGLYQAPERTSARVGCANPSAIAKTPLGLFFDSPQGIYLMSRGLESQYVGAPVESTWKALTITAAVVAEDQSQVRFMSSQGTTLVYDWALGAWTTFTNQPARHAIVHGGRVTWISATDGTIQQETPGAWSDNGAPITTSITTGWLSFASLQTFKRVKGVRIFGTRHSAHSLAFSIAYDQVDSDTAYPAIADVGAGAVYQPEIPLSRQKLGFLRVKAQDSLIVAGEGARWHGLAFDLALKGGFPRTDG